MHFVVVFLTFVKLKYINRNMDDKEFQIRTYGFGELAQLYFPNIAKASASRMFSQWVQSSPQLIQSLQEANWKKRAKYLSPKQVKVLIMYFDPPF